MTTDTAFERRTTAETTAGPDAKRRPPSWPMALASVGICLGTGAAVVLIDILH